MFKTDIGDNMKYSDKAIKLNLGCGDRFNRGVSWLNTDFMASPPFVYKTDLRKKLPFKNARFEFIYSSHVLDHFEPLTAELIIEEIYRCLRPGGILRIVVPDLEFNCRHYLKSVEDNGSFPEKHHWFMIELLDQMTRPRHGGEKAKFIRMAKESRDPAMRNRMRPLLGQECWIDPA